MMCTPAPASHQPVDAADDRAVWKSDWKIALDAGSSSMPDQAGRIAFRAELSIPLCDAVIAREQRTAAKARPEVRVQRETGAAYNAQMASTMSSSLRRSTASTSDPPSSEPMMSGNSWASETCQL